MLILGANLYTIVVFFLFGQNIWEILEDFFSNGNSTNCFLEIFVKNFNIIKLKGNHDIIISTNVFVHVLYVMSLTIFICCSYKLVANSIGNMNFYYDHELPKSKAT